MPIFFTPIFKTGMNKIHFLKNEEITPLKRRLEYIERTIYTKDAAKEIRTSEVMDVLNKYYDDAAAETAKVITKYRLKYFIVGAANYILNFSVFKYLPILYSIFAFSNGSLNLGDLPALLVAVSSFSFRTNGLTNCYMKLSEKGIYIENIIKFKNLKSNIEESDRVSENKENKKVSKIESIEYKNVNFRYAGNDSYTLKNINLKIEKGQKIALVGYNGAGKTTFIKTLLRLYDIENGCVLINQNPVDTINLKSYREKVSVVLQDFHIYPATVAENILCRKVNNNNDIIKIDDALKKFGLYEKIYSFPETINTYLSKEADNSGIELSGGEKQKIALARLEIKNPDIIILDEPTSALDPFSESKFIDGIMGDYGDKMIILVSHRLSNIKKADMIYVFDNGIVIEKGSHEKLMLFNGKYAEMYNMQKEKYEFDKSGDEL
jgi:ATP-binding cassette subfamily B protein